MNPIVSNGNKLNWKIEKIKELTHHGMNSNTFTFQRNDWNIYIVTKTENSMKYLAVYLCHESCKNEYQSTWICEAKRVFKLLNQNENGKDWMREDVYFYDDNRYGLSYSISIEWSKLESDGYMKDDSIVVEIDLDFKLYDFSKNMQNFYTDIILNVEDTELYVNKEALCSRFDYFLKKINNEKVVKIENLKAEHFRLFIASLFSVEITDEIGKLQKSTELGKQIDITKPGDLKMNPIVSNGNKLKWKFENINELTDDGMCSDKFTFQGIDWEIKICTRLCFTKLLSVHLYYDGDNKTEKTWICQTKTIFKVLNQNGNEKDITRKDVRNYDASECKWGYSMYTEWSRLISGGYMKDNSIIVEIELDFKYYDFSKNIPNYTDITFNVQGTKFYVNKEALCSRFDYFLKKINNEKRVKIENLKVENFRLFIASLFSIEITDEIGKLQISTESGSQNDITEPIIEKKMVDVPSTSERNKIDEKQLKCQSCTKMDIEENLQICQTCNEQNLKHFKNEEDVLKVAICALCALKKHMKQGHVIDEFLPYYRAYKFKNYSGEIGTMLAKFQSAEIYWKSKEQTWKTMNETTEIKLNELIDLTRQSKSTKYLQENMNDVKGFIETAKNVNDSLIEVMKTKERLLQQNLQEIEKWIEEKSKECVKDE